MQAGSASPDILRAVRQIGHELRVARRRRRLTQQQVAERAGLSRETVLKAEAGHPGLALSAFLEILAVFDPDMMRSVVQGVEDDPIGQALERQRLPARVVSRDDF